MYVTMVSSQSKLIKISYTAAMLHACRGSYHMVAKA